MVFFYHFSNKGAMSITVEIDIEKVNKNIIYQGETLEVLRDIDLSIKKQEIVSIIGPSGCGKSTLLNLIAGLDNPDVGSIHFQGFNQEDRLGSVSYMQQKDLLFPWRTVLENISLSLEIKGISKKDSTEICRKYLSEFQLEKFEKNLPHTLSGGMRQRVAFLRTLLTDSEILLLDEPFGALDALTRRNLYVWFMNLLENNPRTVILVTHDVEEAIFLSDRIFLLSPRPGQIELIEEVSFERPRTYEIISDPNFVNLKSRLLHQLSEIRDE